MLLFAAATLLFIWGAFKYLWSADDAAARQAGAQHMLWGIIGLVVMSSAFALLQLTIDTFFPDSMFGGDADVKILR